MTFVRACFRPWAWLWSWLVLAAALLRDVVDGFKHFFCALYRVVHLLRDPDLVHSERYR